MTYPYESDDKPNTESSVAGDYIDNEDQKRYGITQEKGDDNE